MSETGGGGLARVPNLRVCKHLLISVWHTQGEKGELTSCRGTVWSAWQKPPVRRKGGRAGLPAMVSGRHVVRGRQSSPILEVSPGNRQSWWKRSIFRWNGRQLTLDKIVGSRVWWHTQGSSGRPSSDPGWRSSSRTAPGSLSTGSRAGRTPPHRDSSMYSQANVGASKSCGSLSERCRPWSWTLKRCCGKRMGPLKVTPRRVCFGWKGVRPGVRLESQQKLVRSRRTQAAGSRMDGKPLLDLWDLIVTVLNGNTNQSKLVRWNLSTSLTRKKIPGKIDDLNNVDSFPSNANSSRQEAVLYIFENNEAVVKLIIKGRSPAMRHVSRTHRVALDWLCNRIMWTPRSKSNFLTPKSNWQTYWPRELSHVMSGIIFCVCSTLAISVLPNVLKWCRKEHKKVQVKT